MGPIQEELHKLRQQLNDKPTNTSTNQPMLEGEDFKRYLSELRGKSTNFKRKKAELSAVDTEYGILQRTEDVF
jgi:intraflagellar transport protein 81